MSTNLPLGARPATHATAWTNVYFIRIELADDAGRTEQGVTVSAGRRLLVSQTRADNGPELVQVLRTGPWVQSDETWIAPVMSEPAVATSAD